MHPGANGCICRNAPDDFFLTEPQRLSHGNSDGGRISHVLAGGGNIQVIHILFRGHSAGDAIDAVV